jgi:tetratricopeptide (TPR) repeat protein
LLIIGWVAGGCAAVDERAANFASLAAPVELTATPFHAQDRFQCGPAALTTILQASGVDISLENVTDRVYLPGRHGSLQAELLATTRASKRIPYRIDPSLDALIAELEAERPVLVLQNLGVSWKPVWHYAVVIGVDPANERVILRSGTEYRRSTPVKVFLRTWARSENWGLVALAPGALPAKPDRARFLRAVADFDSTGRTRSAYASWERAVAAWPEDPGALFGMANAAFTLNEYAVAETHYRRLLDISPASHAARNNLAYAMARQGRAIEAIEEIEFILHAVDSDDPFRPDYEDSWSEIAAMLPPKERAL